MIARLLCRLRGHDDAVTILFPPAAVLSCDRCGRRRLVELRAKLPRRDPAGVVEGLVSLVSRDALEELMLSASVNAALADALARRIQDEG